MAEGFHDTTGSYGFAGMTLTGVFLPVTPASINDGAPGDEVLEVLVPDDIDLAGYAIYEEAAPAPWEFIVPATVLNRRAIRPIGLAIRGRQTDRTRAATMADEPAPADMASRRWSAG